MRDKIKGTYDVCKAFLTTSETTQLDKFDVAEDKLNNLFIAYHWYLTTINRHLDRLRASVSVNAPLPIALTLTPTHQ